MLSIEIDHSIFAAPVVTIAGTVAEAHYLSEKAMESGDSLASRWYAAFAWAIERARRAAMPYGEPPTIGDLRALHRRWRSDLYPISAHASR